MLVVPVPDPDPRAPLQGVYQVEGPTEDPVGGGADQETGRWKDRWKVWGPMADERCGRAVLDFLSTTDMERGVPAEEEDAVSEVSEAEVREWLEEQGAGAEVSGAGEEPPLFLPMPDFMASAEEV